MSNKLTAEFYAEKAKKELNETESRREQSLKKFREWIDKHSFMSNIDADEMILLSCLRASKYNLNRAFESFEILIVKYIIPRIQCPLDGPFELLKNGFVVIFKKRDENGCRNVFFDFAKLDPKKFSNDDLQLLITVIFIAFMREHETQISGVNIYADMTNFTIDHLPLMLSNKMADGLKDTKSIPFRIKKATFIGLSMLGEKFIEFLKNFLSEKLQKRIISAKTCDYVVGVDEVEDMESKFDKVNEDFGLLIQSKVNSDVLKKYPKYETVESFRKLEID